IYGMTIAVTQTAEGLPRRAFTVGDVLRMVDAGILGHDERIELIGGEIVPMSPKGIRHERLKQWVNKRLARGLTDAYEVIPETTFYLSDDTFIEPDFVVYPASSGLENLSPETCLLAIEIADSSLSYDLGRKAAIYAHFGIRELWVMDVVAQRVVVHLSVSQKGFQDIFEFSFEHEIAPSLVDGLTLDLSAYKV
ncbi:MAG: Uma2 family endonuclease, partial [Pseudomonadota bacterium]